jgi:hypothetical protein
MADRKTISPDGYITAQEASRLHALRQYAEPTEEKVRPLEPKVIHEAAARFGWECIKIGHVKAYDLDDFQDWYFESLSYKRSTAEGRKELEDAKKIESGATAAAKAFGLPKKRKVKCLTCGDTFKREQRIGFGRCGRCKNATRGILDLGVVGDGNRQTAIGGAE